MGAGLFEDSKHIQYHLSIVSASFIVEKYRVSIKIDMSNSYIKVVPIYSTLPACQLPNFEDSDDLAVFHDR